MKWKFYYQIRRSMDCDWKQMIDLLSLILHWNFRCNNKGEYWNKDHRQFRKAVHLSKVFEDRKSRKIDGVGECKFFLDDSMKNK